MKVKLSRSLGRGEADKLGIDASKLTEGSVVEVGRPDGESLVDRGLAADVTPKPEPSKPAPTKTAVPDPIEAAKPKAVKQTQPAAKPAQSKGK